MNRRSFLRRLGIGAVGVAAAVYVPTSALNAVGLGPAATDRALDMMRLAFNRYAQDRMKAGVPMSLAFPRQMIVGRDLYEAAEGEMTICERFVSARDEHAFVDNFAFKGATVTHKGRGWDIAFA